MTLPIVVAREALRRRLRRACTRAAHGDLRSEEKVNIVKVTGPAEAAKGKQVSQILFVSLTSWKDKASPVFMAVVFSLPCWVDCPHVRFPDNNSAGCDAGARLLQRLSRWIRQARGDSVQTGGDWRGSHDV